MKKYAIIVAGGCGTRLGGDLPKQFQNLQGRPVLWWSMKAFHDEDPATQIILVLNQDYFDVWEGLLNSLPEGERILHKVCCGGKSRTESVKNGLRLVPAADDVLVAVHDAARPLINPEMISGGWEAGAVYGAAVPAVAVTDSLRKISGEGSEAVDRSDYVAVQTPQVFKASVIKNAYDVNPDAVFSDDASAAEAAGHKTVLYKGSPRNMKVTNPGDIEIAGLLLTS